MRIHLIAIGGSAMHNLAIALHNNHHTVTGSDDEIYSPSRERLEGYGLLPPEMGWHPDKITEQLDFIILGMHARAHNPELLRAQQLGIPIYSYPAFIYQHAKDKTRVVVAGSHGKTSTTSMIMHVLNYHRVDFDYLVGAQIEGFDTMVRLSDAPLMIIEGDEYLSSPIDRRPKFLHYLPHYAIVTGIAWDHINVFPSFGHYVKQFELFIRSIQQKGKLFYFRQDEDLQKIVAGKVGPAHSIPYDGFEATVEEGQTRLRTSAGNTVELEIFGQHNLQNLKAAFLICRETGLSEAQFFEAIRTFRGAAKRLQVLYRSDHSIAFLDFAHAPSKVKATIEAMKHQYPERRLVACVELHTFSSLNRDFHPLYAHTMDPADLAFVYYNQHTLAMKKLPPLEPASVAQSFQHEKLEVLTDNKVLIERLMNIDWTRTNLLLMTSGTFGGLKLAELAEELLTRSS